MTDHPLFRSRTRAPTQSAAPPSNSGSEGPFEESFAASTANHPIRMAKPAVWSIERLSRANRKVRRRGRGQQDAIIASIQKYGFVTPIIVRTDGSVLDGEGRLEAALALGYVEVPVAVVDGPFTEAEFQALRLAVNRLGERGEWIPEALALDLADILSADPLLATFTGFDMPEIDRALLTGLQPIADGEATPALETRAVSQVGDLWLIGPHRLLCADAKEAQSYATLLADLTTQMVLSDVPYGVKIGGVVSRHHREFVEGSDLNEEELLSFFDQTLRAANAYIPAGCIVDLFIDHRGMYALTTAFRGVGLEHLCTAVWDKISAGMGGLYRHQVEFVMVLKQPGAKSINNVQLGKHGRNRTTLWTAPGFAGFGAERSAALERHPTCKPVSLLKDAILDVTEVGGAVLDMFAGSGSTLVAAHQTRRVGVGMELDPLYVDQSVRRLQDVVGETARHADTGLTFDETSARRANSSQGE